MNGRTHALSGAVAYLAAAPLLIPTAPPEVAAVGAVMAAGAALLPDLDHPDATAARAYGPITWVLARAVCAVSGGHRGATHSLLGIAVAGGLAAAVSYAGGWPLTVAVWLCVGLAVRALRGRTRRGGMASGLVSAAACAVPAWWLVHGSGWVVAAPTGWALAVGYAAHIAGDALTEHGVPLGWPHRRRYRLASIDTGEWVETRLVAPALGVALAVLAWRVATVHV